MSLNDDMAPKTFSWQKKKKKKSQHFHCDTSDSPLHDFTVLYIAAPVNSVSSGSLSSLMTLWAPLMTPSPQCKYPVLYDTLFSIPVLYICSFHVFICMYTLVFSTKKTNKSCYWVCVHACVVLPQPARGPRTCPPPAPAGTGALSWPSWSRQTVAATTCVRPTTAAAPTLTSSASGQVVDSPALDKRLEFCPSCLHRSGEFCLCLGYYCYLIVVLNLTDIKTSASQLVTRDPKVDHSAVFVGFLNLGHLCCRTHNSNAVTSAIYLLIESGRAFLYMWKKFECRGLHLGRKSWKERKKVETPPVENRCYSTFSSNARNCQDKIRDPQANPELSVAWGFQKRAAVDVDFPSVVASTLAFMLFPVLVVLFDVPSTSLAAFGSARP